MDNVLGFPKLAAFFRHTLEIFSLPLTNGTYYIAALQENIRFSCATKLAKQACSMLGMNNYRTQIYKQDILVDCDIVCMFLQHCLCLYMCYACLKSNSMFNAH